MSQQTSDATRLRTGRLLAALGGTIGLYSLALYIVAMVREGNNSTGQLAGWGLAMLVPSLLAFAATGLPPRPARMVLVLGAIGFGLLAVVSGFSFAYWPAALVVAVAAAMQSAVPQKRGS